MDYSRIRNAIDREIHIDGLSQGGLCFLNGPSYYIIHISVEGQFSAEFEILNREIYTIRSYSSTENSKFKAKIDSNKFYFELYPSTSATLRLGIEYTNNSVTINNSGSFSNDTAYVYNFNELYVIKPLEFNGSKISVNDLDINKLTIGEFTSTNTTLNLNNKNVTNIGELHIKETHLDVMDVDTIYADVIDTTSITLGKWKLEKVGNDSIKISVS